MGNYLQGIIIAPDYCELFSPQVIVAPPATARIPSRGGRNLRSDHPGKRLQKTDYINSLPVTTTDYISNFVYNNNTVAYAQSAEGRIVFTTPTTVYSESYITDHLGNVRATFRSNATGQVVLLQTNNYYPYGLRVNTSAYESTFPNEYFYQGKELDNENGLNLYNFHARLYDPVLGRWHTPDSYDYKFPSWSTYCNTFDNPINYIDPDGKCPLPILILAGAILAKYAKENGDTYGIGDGNQTYKEWKAEMAKKGNTIIADFSIGGYHFAYAKYR